MGAYFVQTGQFTLAAFVASVPSGILVHNLPFLNEFPDVEADRKGGRKTLPILLGQKRASILYSILTLFMYVWIIGGTAAGVLPAFSLIAIMTLPLASKAIQGARGFDHENRLLPGLGFNVQVVLLTQFLLGLGYILAGIF